VALIAAQGCPNYFGEQRFGREGSNLERALRLKAQHLRRKQPRDGMALSAMRSWLFNEYLGERVEAGNWRDVLEGDPALRGVPTGPLFGDGGTSAAGAQGAAEQAVLERHPVFKALFDAGRMPPDRRDLVLYPKDLCIEWQDDYLCVQTFLPSGAFLTTLLAELIDFSSGAISLQEAATGAGQDVQGSPDEVVTGK
ncbi:MAG: tRNA pseudouridine(13) synthase TruD, partial [Gammaproteobacteria bacterium]|nr:tRNA pseudouridine(13) synthase TruD [Gammaproteobacteria bacterium]